MPFPELGYELDIQFRGGGGVEEDHKHPNRPAGLESSPRKRLEYQPDLRTGLKTGSSAKGR